MDDIHSSPGRASARKAPPPTEPELRPQNRRAPRPTGKRRDDQDPVQPLRTRGDWDTDLVERMQIVARSERLTIREISRRLGTHHESTRRYMAGDRPSSKFIALFCRAFGVSADWLLNGIEPMRRPGIIPVDCAPEHPVRSRTSGGKGSARTDEAAARQREVKPLHNGRVARSSGSA